MRQFLLVVAFLFVGLLMGCDSLKSDSNDESDGSTNEGDGQTTMLMPLESLGNRYA